jgi:hypothetical protein
MKYLTAIPSGENTGAPLFGLCNKNGPFLGVATSSVPFFQSVFSMLGIRYSQAQKNVDFHGLYACGTLFL